MIYRHCDSITRDTGRLCKVLVVNDTAGLTWRKFDIRFMKALGRSSRVSDVIHPQLSWRNVIVHPPAIMRAMFNVCYITLTASQPLRTPGGCRKLACLNT